MKIESAPLNATVNEITQRMATNEAADNNAALIKLEKTRWIIIQIKLSNCYFYVDAE